MDVAAYWVLGASVIPFALFGVFYPSHKTPSIILFGVGVLCLTVAGCLYWINAVRPRSNPLPPSPITSHKEKLRISDKKDGTPLINQNIENSPGARNTIGSVNIYAPPERHLTSSLRQCLVSSLRQFPDKRQLSFACVMGDNEGLAFMVELQEAFRSAGFPVPDETAQRMFFGANPQGLFIAVRDFASPHPWVDTLFQALSDCGLKGIEGMQDRNLPEDAVAIVVGIKK